MNERDEAALDTLPPEVLLRIHDVCQRFESAWRGGDRPRIEGYVGDVAASGRPALLRELILLDVEYRRVRGDTLSTEDYHPLFPMGVPDWLAREVRGSDRAGRYRLKEELGRGGMGAVYRAYDPDLGRELAVKVLQDRLGPESAATHRFNEETRITAQLQHPGIPPVHDLGTLPDGRPFLAMKLIKGATLEAKLSSRSDPSHDRAAFVSVFEQICHAVAYAHAHGVIHRDLKPANVMVGNFGEVQVMDWGLAKVLGRANEGGDDPLATSAETQVRSLRDGEDARTKAGSVLGTPAYMPPEQAIGAIERIDRRSDVFGLGGILAAMLTGKPPFAGSGAEGTRQLAAMGKVQSCFDRLDASGADPELVTLCKRCLSPEKDGRPADAAEVAKAVAALRAAADERARRAELDRVTAEERRRRRRVWIGAAAALAVALIGGLSAVLVVQRKANAELADGREQVQKRFELAMKAIDTFHTGVSEDAVMRNKDLKGLRDKLLRSAAGYYRELEELLRERQDEASRRALGDAYFKLAYLTNMIGDKERAAAVYRRSLEISAKLAQDHPAVTKYQSDLASSHNNLGLLLRDTGRREEAEKAHRQALLIYAKLDQDHPAATKYQSYLARSHHNLGLLLRDAGRREEAEKAHRQALLIHAKLAQEHPAVTEHQSYLASSHHKLGLLLRDAGRREEAEKAHRQALLIYAKLAQDRPAVTEHQSDLALCHHNLGLLLRDAGRREEAEKALRQALLILAKLAETHPAVTEHQSDLATSHHNLGDLLRDAGRREEAEKAHRQALLIRAKLAQDHPAVTKYQSDLASSHNNLGDLLRDAGRREEAEKAHRQALLIRAKLAQDHPAVTKYQSDLADSHNNLGVLLAETGQREEAEKAHRQALLIRAKLDQDHPAVTKHQSDLAISHNNLGVLLRHAGRDEEAEKAHRQALLIHAKLAQDHPAVTDYQINLAGCCCNLGHLLRDMGQPDKSLPFFQQAIDHLQSLRKAQPRHPTARLYLRNSHAGRAQALGRLKRHREAAADWEQGLALDPGPGRALLQIQLAQSLARGGDYDKAAPLAGRFIAGPSVNNAIRHATARLYALCASAAASEATRPLPQREKRAEGFARAAIEQLRRAQQAGYFRGPKHAADLEKDDDLTFLRSRDDFRQLLADVTE